MLCRLCKSDKLSEEFAPQTLTPNCDHAALLCLRCAVEGAKMKNMCTFPGCGESTEEYQDTVTMLEEIIQDLFPEYEPDETSAELDSGSLSADDFSSATVNVITMTGKSHKVKYYEWTRVSSFKSDVMSVLNVPCKQQKLMFGNMELKDYNPETGREAQLSSYGVRPNSNLHLMVILYEVPKHLNHVVFDISWGFPRGREDFLNASCLLFSGTDVREIINWTPSRRESRLPGAPVVHTGDMMDDNERRGRQFIEVKLRLIPPKITHVFFTLRADHSGTIDRFPGISLGFYDAENRNTNLCSTNFDGESKGIVMVYLERERYSREWQIIKCGQQFGGWGYGPSISVIRSIIEGDNLQDNV